MTNHTPPDVPPIKDLNVENITDNVHIINSKCEDPRLSFLLERLVNHLHDFARETRLSVREWETAIRFLVDVGKISTESRHEFVLLSDILGLSLLFDGIDNPKIPNATEGTVLGPFHTLDANYVEAGHHISKDPDGEPLLVICSVKDTAGRPIPGVAIDVWETDSKGFYDVQYADRVTPDGRAVLQSDEDGIFFFKAIVPVPYPIPDDGPAGNLLGKLKRHPYHPSHMHFMFKKEGYDRLITYVPGCSTYSGSLKFQLALETSTNHQTLHFSRALYLGGDPYESSDAVFGVKESLIVDLQKVENVKGLEEKYDVPADTKLLKYDFVLVTQQEAQNVREDEAWKEAERQGGKLEVVKGLLVPAKNLWLPIVEIPHILMCHSYYAIVDFFFMDTTRYSTKMRVIFTCGR